MRAVCSSIASRACTSAPCASNARTVPTLPARAAVIRAVSPLGSTACGVAPAASSNRTIAGFPFSHAR